MWLKSGNQLSNMQLENANDTIWRGMIRFRSSVKLQDKQIGSACLRILIIQLFSFLMDRL